MGAHCRLKIKLTGSGQSTQPGSSGGKSTNKDGDRWMAECADCGEEGDLLCCEVLPISADFQMMQRSIILNPTAHPVALHSL